MSKDEKVWDAVEVLEAEVVELKDAVTYSIKLILSLAATLGCTYKIEEIVMEDGKKGAKGWFEKAEKDKKSHLILP